MAYEHRHGYGHRYVNGFICAAALLALAACGDDTDFAGTPDAGAADSAPAPDAGPSGVPALGGGSHALSSLKVEVVADSKDGLNSPTDVALHPLREDELWITSQADDAMVVIFAVGRVARKAGKAKTPSGQHFLANPSGLAFNTKDGMFATIHEEDQLTQASTPTDFMGPTLWSSNLTIFDGGHAGHMDMLHNTPNGMGIAWEKDNAYWVFDGAHSSLTRYDFQMSHGPGGADHTDGVVRRYAEGKVKRVAGVPAHMELDHKAGLLYVADTGNRRVAVLKIGTGKVGADIYPNYDGSSQKKVDGATISTLVDAKAGLQRPSGLALHKGVLYVGDNGSGRVHAFDPESGKQLDYLDTKLPAGALRGITFDAAGRLYLVDGKGQRVLRLSPKK